MADGGLAPLQHRLLNVLDNIESHDIWFEVIGSKEERRCLSAHRIIVAELSEPFRTMLTGDFVEGRKAVIPMRGITVEALQVVIYFAYTCALPLTLTSRTYDYLDSVGLLLDLLRFSDQWQILDLGDACVREILSTHLTLSDAVYAFSIACSMKHTRPIFLKEVRAMLSGSILDAIKEDAFVDLSEDAVEELLKFNRLFVHGEHDLLAGLCQWVKHNHDSDDLRLGKLVSMAQHLRYSQLPRSEAEKILVANGFPANSIDILYEECQKAELGRVLVPGFHFVEPAEPGSVHFASFNRKITNATDNMQAVFMDRNLVEMVDNGHEVEWILQVHKVNTTLFVGASLPTTFMDHSEIYGRGGGISSDGRLYQAIIESPDSTHARFACRRVQRLRFGAGAQLSCTFSVGEVMEGRPRDHAGGNASWVTCPRCDVVRRHPYVFRHRHAQLSISIKTPHARRLQVISDFVIGENVKLYPFVVFKQQGDCVELIDRFGYDPETT